MGFFTVTKVILLCFVVYCGILIQSLLEVLAPQFNLERVDPATKIPYPTLTPAWTLDTEYSVTIKLGIEGVSFADKDHVMLVPLLAPGETTLKLNHSLDTFFSLNLNLTRDNVPDDWFWDSLARNRRPFVDFHFRATESPSQYFMSRASMTTQLPRARHLDIARRFLLQSHPWFLWFYTEEWVQEHDPEETHIGVPSTAVGTNLDVPRGGDIVYWTPLACLSIVTDWEAWPIKGAPRSVVSNLKYDRKNKTHYFPATSTEQLGLTRDSLIQVNKTNTILPLEVRVQTMSLSRWQFGLHMESVFRAQASMGAAPSEIEDMRRIITETSPTLLLVTLVVSLVHLLLDLLAFKSDISFWRHTSSMQGLSRRTVFMGLVSQVVVGLYLWDHGASLLLLVPSVLGLVIQTWKCFRVFGMQRKEEMTKLSRASEESDKMASYYMGALLGPLTVVYTVYSLLYEKHTGFSSWLIGSLASSVYAFGFAMMTPQLFINYKLKSVARLPWKVLGYRAVNTFIDDLFAFIIRMPTLHRAAAFRDDAVFLLYLYQRYVYKVDESRPMEGVEGSVEVDRVDTDTWEVYHAQRELWAKQVEASM